MYDHADILLAYCNIIAIQFLLNVYIIAVLQSITICMLFRAIMLIHHVHGYIISFLLYHTPIAKSSVVHSFWHSSCLQYVSPTIFLTLSHLTAMLYQTIHHADVTSKQCIHDTSLPIFNTSFQLTVMLYQTSCWCSTYSMQTIFPYGIAQQSKAII